MNLLILDDEVISVEIMLSQVHWEDCGIHTVLTAYDVDEAKNVVTQNPIDIILCDIEMPGENGISFMHWAREQGYDMECVFLTCHAKFEYAQEAVRLNSRDYILLPAPFSVIEDKVKECVAIIQDKRKNQRVQTIGQQWVEDKKREIQLRYGTARSNARTADEIELYVQEHLGDTALTVQSIAEHMGLNADYMGQVYKHEKNGTINKYIVAKRMEMASSLIRETDFNIALIAEMVGYENYSYFSVSFKKAYGCSPAKYGKESEQ